MAIVLKSSKTFQDPHDLSDIDTCYGVIDQCNGNKKSEVQIFVLDIYRTEEARMNGGKPIYSQKFNVTDDEWQEHFSINSVEPNQYAAAYNYLLTIAEQVLNEETGEYEDGDPIWGDWESDE